MTTNGLHTSGFCALYWIFGTWCTTDKCSLLA